MHTNKICPYCGKSFKSLGNHQQKNDCGKAASIDRLISFEAQYGRAATEKYSWVATAEQRAYVAQLLASSVAKPFPFDADKMPGLARLWKRQHG